MNINLLGKTRSVLAVVVWCVSLAEPVIAASVSPRTEPASGSVLAINGNEVAYVAWEGGDPRRADDASVELAPLLLRFPLTPPRPVIDWIAGFLESGTATRALTITDVDFQHRPVESIDFGDSQLVDMRLSGMDGAQQGPVQLTLVIKPAGFRRNPTPGANALGSRGVPAEQTSSSHFFMLSVSALPQSSRSVLRVHDFSVKAGGSGQSPRLVVELRAADAPPWKAWRDSAIPGAAGLSAMSADSTAELAFFRADATRPEMALRFSGVDITRVSRSPGQNAKGDLFEAELSFTALTLRARGDNLPPAPESTAPSANGGSASPAPVASLPPAASTSGAPGGPADSRLANAAEPSSAADPASSTPPLTRLGAPDLRGAVRAGSRVAPAPEAGSGGLGAELSGRPANAPAPAGKNPASAEAGGLKSAPGATVGATGSGKPGGDAKPQEVRSGASSAAGAGATGQKSELARAAGGLGAMERAHPQDVGSRDPAGFPRKTGTIRTGFTGNRTPTSVSESATYTSPEPVDAVLDALAKDAQASGWQEKSQSESVSVGSERTVFTQWAKDGARAEVRTYATKEGGSEIYVVIDSELPAKEKK